MFFPSSFFHHITSQECKQHEYRREFSITISGSPSGRVVLQFHSQTGKSNSPGTSGYQTCEPRRAKKWFRMKIRQNCYAYYGLSIIFIYLLKSILNCLFHPGMSPKKLVRYQLWRGSKIWSPLKIMCLLTGPSALLCHDVNLSLNNNMEPDEHIRPASQPPSQISVPRWNHASSPSRSENRPRDTDLTS